MVRRRRLISRSLRRHNLPLLWRRGCRPLLRRIVRGWPLFVVLVRLYRPGVLSILRRRRILWLRRIRPTLLLHVLRRGHRSASWLHTGRNRLRPLLLALIVVRRLVRTILLRILRRGHRSAGWLRTRGYRLRPLLMFIRIICWRIRIHLRIQRPLNSLHRSNGIRSRRTARISQVWRVGPLLLVALSRWGLLILIASRAIGNPVRRRRNNGPSWQRLDFVFRPDGRSNWSCVWPGGNLFALLVDQNWPLDRHGNRPCHWTRDNRSTCGSHLRLG